MKKPVLSVDEPEQKKILRGDRPPTEGFVTIGISNQNLTVSTLLKHRAEN
jgi:hypothetical protein